MLILCFLKLTVMNSCLRPFLFVLTGFESGHHHPVMHFSWYRHSKIISLTPDLPDPPFWWTQVYFPWDDIRNHSTSVTIFCIASHESTAPNIHIHPSIHPSIYPSIHLSLYLSIYLSIYLSMSVRPSVCPSVILFLLNTLSNKLSW